MPPPVPVMRPVQEEPPGGDRREAFEGLAHPVLLRHGSDNAVSQFIEFPGVLCLFRAGEIEHHVPKALRLVRLVDGDGHRIDAEIVLECRGEVVGAVMGQPGQGEGVAGFSHEGR